MSVSIHHIYSSVTRLFSVALLPSENTQKRTKFVAPTGRASFFFEDKTGFTPVHIRGRSLCGRMKKKSVKNVSVW